MNNNLLLNIEFKELVTDFRKELVKENKSNSFIEETVNHVTELLGYAEENGISTMNNLSQQLLNDYSIYLEQERINKRRGSLLSAGTIRKHHSSINNFFNYLKAEKVFVPNIHLKRRKVSHPEKPAIALTHQEIEWLYSVTDNSALGYRDRCMLSIYYGCGLRKIEGLRILLTDIDFNSRRIFIGKSKTNSQNYVTAAPKVLQYIEEYVYQYRDVYLRENSAHNELFISERGVPMHPETIANRIKVLWKRVREQYGSEKHIGCHTLRHTLGTHLYMAGLDIETIAFMLRHKTLQSTQVYIHLANELTNTSKLVAAHEYI